MLYTCITYESRHEHGHYPTETVADRGEAHRISCAMDIRQTTPGQTDRQTDGWLELRNHERNHGEKLYGISRGVDVDPLPFPILSFPSLPLLLHPCFTHFLHHSSFLLHSN